jgi:hypothetical protein
VTDEGDVFMMFSPAEHTDSMKRRKERKRRERIEKRNNASSKSTTQNLETTTTEQKTPEKDDKSSLAPIAITPTKSQITMDSSSRTVVRGNPSPRSVSVLPVADNATTTTPTRNNNEKPQYYKITQHPQSSLVLDGEYNYTSTPSPSRGEHRGASPRIIIHETRGQSGTTTQHKSSSSPWKQHGNTDTDSTTASSDEYNNNNNSNCDSKNVNDCNAIRKYCEEMPADDDDMFYTKWCSFCILDNNQNGTKRTKR